MSEHTKVRAAAVIPTQKEMLIQFVKDNPNLRIGRFSQNFTFKMAQKLWNEITEKLNAVAGGAKKDWRQWRKTWQDLKKKTKSKIVEQKKHFNETGGGPPAPLPKIENIDNDIMEIITNTEIHGLDTCEPKIDFDFAAEESKEQDGSSEIMALDGNIQEKIVTLENEDHNYTLPVPLEPGASSKGSHYRQSKKLTKARRLETSQKLSSELLKNINTRNSILEEYYKEKISYLRHRKQWETQLLKVIEHNTHANLNIFETLSTPFVSG